MKSLNRLAAGKTISNRRPVEISGSFDNALISLLLSGESSIHAPYTAVRLLNKSKLVASQQLISDTGMRTYVIN